MFDGWVPLAVAVSLIVFGEQVDFQRLLLSAALLALAVWVAQRTPVTLPLPSGESRGEGHPQ